MKYSFRFFIVFFSAVFMVIASYANSEGVYFFNEESVLFHSENYTIYNYIKTELKSNPSLIKEAEKSVKNYFVLKEKKYKKVIAKVNLSKSCTETKQTYTLYEKRKKVKECSFVSKSTKSVVTAFNNIPNEKRSPLMTFVIQKEVIIVVKKMITKVFKLMLNVYTVLSSLVFYMLYSMLLFFFYPLITQKDNIIGYWLKRGPPTIYYNIKNT